MIDDDRCFVTNPRAIVAFLCAVIIGATDTPHTPHPFNISVSVILLCISGDTASIESCNQEC
ncbi:hypothetical protein BDW60DRAFT_184531 [Aspergillus nidulans var. acristatus]|jgi:hypothetical protein